MPNKIIIWFITRSIYLKIFLVITLIGISWFTYQTFFNIKSTTPQYATATVERGTLINSVNATGTITSGDTTYITTGATGTVSKVYVKNGDTVKKNQKLAEISLDDIGQETQITAWNNYQEASVKAKDAITTQHTLEITMLQNKQAVSDAERAQRDAHSGGWNPSTKQPYTDNELTIVTQQYPQAQSAYDAAIKDYEIGSSNIALANAKVSAAYRNYQKVSSSIVAPADGILNNLTLAPGVVIGDSSNASSITVSTGTDTTSNSVSVSSQKIGAIKNPAGQYQATVSLTEVDVTKVQSGQKVTLTLDAYPDKSLTGTVLAVNTSGSVSSGVTSYSAIILVDKTELNLYTNMAVSATIIVSSEADVLLVPTTAVTSNGSSKVTVILNGKTEERTVEIGSNNDSQTIIKSGLNEGETVVTSVISATTTTTSSSNTRSSGNSGSTNLFSGNRNQGGFMGGGPGF